MIYDVLQGKIEKDTILLYIVNEFKNNALFNAHRNDKHGSLRTIPKDPKKGGNRMIEEAILFALKAHGGAKRKGKDRPYILHPLEVMTIVAGLTDDEEVIAAAVLHDTVEDAGVTLQDLREAFGEHTAALVASESENKREGTPAAETWQLRKQETIDHLQTAGRETKLICLGDKLSNLREMRRDFALAGDALWDRFNQKDKRMHGWYYRAIYEILSAEFGPVAELKEYGALWDVLFG